MINAYAKLGDAQTAELWLQEMVGKGIAPDQITYATLLRAFPTENAEESSRWTYSALVRACALAGSVSGVQHWLANMARSGVKPACPLRDEIIEIAGKLSRKLQGQLIAVVSKTQFIESPRYAVAKPPGRINQGQRSGDSGYMLAKVPGLLAPESRPGHKRQNSRKTNKQNQQNNAGVKMPTQGYQAPRHGFVQSDNVTEDEDHQLEHLSL